MQLPQPGETPEPNGFRLVPVAFSFYLVLALGGAIWMGLRDGRVRLDRYLRLDQLPLDLLLGVGTGLALVGLWLLGLRLLPPARELEATLRSILSELKTADAFALAVLSGFAEETFFRGGLQGAFGRPVMGVVLAALAFAALHTGPGRSFRLWTLYALLAGIACGLLVMRREVLLPAIVAHGVVNGVNLQRLVRARRTPPLNH